MKLKRCPFCGGKCCVCELPYAADGKALWRAHCMDCDCQISANKNNESFETHDEAANAWNTRKG